MRSNILFLVALLGTTVGWTGCSGSHVPPAKADSETAVEMLKLTLDYWKSGETANTLRSQSPGVHAADDDANGPGGDISLRHRCRGVDQQAVTRDKCAHGKTLVELPRLPTLTRVPG